MSCCCSGGEPDDSTAGNDVEMQERGSSARQQKADEDQAYRIKMKDRSCTDVVCLVLFIVFICGLGVVAYFASQGDPYTLIYPTDSQGNLCGRSNQTANQRHLVFFDLLECFKMGPRAIIAGGCPTPQVCVERCPNRNWAWMDLWAREEAPGSSRDVARRKQEMVCRYGDPQNNTQLSVFELVSQGLCAPYYLNSTSVGGRCIPSIFADIPNLLAGIESKDGNTLRTGDNLTEIRYTDIANASSYLSLFLSTITVAQDAFNDVVTSRFLILGGIGIGAVVAFIWCVLLRCTAAFMVYGSLLVFFLVFVAISGYCFWIYFFDVTLQSFQDTLGNSYFTTNFSVYLRIKETWLAFGITSGIVMLIVLLVLLCLRKRLQLAIALVREASKAIAGISSALFFPIWPLLFQIIVIAAFTLNAVLLGSTGKKMFAQTNSTSRESQPCDNATDFVTCQFVRYGSNEWSYYLQGYNLFMGFWLSAFVVSFGQLVLAGAFASYYWAWEKPKDIPALPILHSLARAVRYHLGTVAFGSLLIAIVKFIRAILSYLESKLKGRENLFVKFIFCCLKCFFWCLEKFLKFLTKNAYIVTAINGKNFCLAAKQAFGIILNNCVRFAVVDNVTSFVLFVGKLIVTGLITAVAFLFFNGQIRIHSSLEVDLHYFFVPVILIGISTWIICSLFFSVFDFAVDTMFLCAMVDVSKNDGSKEKPYYMSKGLMKALDVKNQFVDVDPDDREGCCCCC
ncbi:hypothetical protein BOX15_Mlig003702g2 [Macrostomum lignano]|uniref:Choline transporter-like protein n=1 Tax=Macrostomum lignano TaxID=282301 RepID=A0A267FSV9_9PLAT|nr:hypothetical protein BOX15_Mlig003702g2 [Macrostomum lignano]